MSEYSYHDSELSCSSYYVLPVVRDLLRDLPQGALVADLGCGNGSMLGELRCHGWELHGLEMSRSGLEEAARSFPEVQFSYADLTTHLSEHPLLGRCDAVISTEVVEHLFFPRVYATNCYQLLKPDGRLIISTPYHGYWKNLLLAVTGKMDPHFSPLWDYGHIKFWSRATLTELLVQAGLVVTRFVGAGRLPYLWKSMVLEARRVDR